MIDGVAVPYALARASGHDWRGNLAVGTKGVVQPYQKRDRWICNQVGLPCESVVCISLGLMWLVIISRKLM